MWRASDYDSFHLSSDSDDETSPFHSNKLESESDSIDFVPRTCFDSATPTKSSDLRSLVPEKPRRTADDVIQSTGSESLLAANQLPTPAPHKSGDSRSSVPEFSVIAPPKSRNSRSSVPEISVMATDFGIGSSGPEIFNSKIPLSSHSAPESGSMEVSCSSVPDCPSPGEALEGICASMVPTDPYYFLFTECNAHRNKRKTAEALERQ